MSPLNTAPAAPRGLRTAAIVAAIVLLAIVAIGLTTRARSASELRAWTAENAIPTVAVVQPQPLGAAAALQLPGRLEAYAQAPLYARASGYLKRWTVDIGAPVKAGQVLAEIETPELDQQLAQARADLAKAEADAELARSTAKRWQSMLGTDAVSKQEVDEKTGDAAVKDAAAQSARANLERLVATQGFKRVVAPFDGVVTARNTDVGALITAGGGSPLFIVADTQRLRLYAQVPQVYVPSIQIGQAATLSVPEQPGRHFDARIESMARAVSATSGGALVQMVVDNADGALLPGGYADVSLELPGRAVGATIPASTLIFNADGMQVATLGADGKVAMKPVTITRDLGKVVEVSGLDDGARIIDSPPDSLLEGDPVRVAEKPADDKAAAPAGTAKKG
ncbi:efflux RND transporter periplasmic adaptor subunit [Solimonas variicoloris]|uniref:efflux RND transporter periplasmic adaptor subunit n=1 Tax=Solimonas variicoloris TaxID=254408 RepID=UPI000375097F|nr:efflux RND transporter periplasmic adaptor subunit [Solimonas variicoloris]